MHGMLCGMHRQRRGIVLCMHMTKAHAHACCALLVAIARLRHGTPDDSMCLSFCTSEA